MGFDDVMAMVLWRKYFLESQGYNVNKYIFQYNYSDMLLQKNGRASSRKRTRHINIRYVFVVDRVKFVEVKIKYLSTDDMIRDYFTKPLKGAIFIIFLEQILNIQLYLNILTPVYGSKPQEYVSGLIYE